MKFNLVISKGFFAAYSKTVNHEAPVDKEFCLSSRAYCMFLLFGT